jgi:hypothetical protein
MQVLIKAETKPVLAVGRPMPCNHNDCTAFADSGIDKACGESTVIADGGYQGTGLLIPHRRKAGQDRLPQWKEEHNASHRRVRARVEHVFARIPPRLPSEGRRRPLGHQRRHAQPRPQ